MGRFTAQKNHAFLIDVFAEVAKRRDDAVLLLVGTGEAGASVKALVGERGLTDRVKFLGQRSDVNRLYQAFDAFVLPSLYEGLVPRRRRGTGVWLTVLVERCDYA